MSNIPFPDHWTAHEALVASEFLNMIDNEIWARYGTEMMAELDPYYNSNPPDLDCFDKDYEFDDEISF
ncbi:MAG: hypothetical protein GY792_17635 [Gammaproteobacteria bacterium]|nr:hypothetical protein [Gammaproteobacteria bacterium]